MEEFVNLAFGSADITGVWREGGIFFYRFLRFQVVCFIVFRLFQPCMDINP